MGQRTFVFDDKRFAEGFIEGVEAVNDSSFRIWNGPVKSDIPGKWEVVIEDDDYTEDEEEDEDA